MSALVFPHTSFSRIGCHGTDIDEAASVCISLNCSAVLCSRESLTRDRVHLLLVASFWPARVWISNQVALHGRFQSGGNFCLRQGAQSFTLAGVMDAMGLASERAQLIDSGHSAEVAENILHSRASSMRKQNTLKWALFVWCGNRQQDPVYCWRLYRSDSPQGYLPPLQRFT